MPTTLFDLISPDAFSSLWYWVVTAIVWSRMSQAPLGISADLYERAAQYEDKADLIALVRQGALRHLGMTHRFGALLVGLWAFALSGLFGLAVIYGLELAQAVLFLVVPLAASQGITTVVARRFARAEPNPSALLRDLRRLRVAIQVIGLAAIFCAALFGMIHNLRTAGF